MTRGIPWAVLALAAGFTGLAFPLGAAGTWDTGRAPLPSPRAEMASAVLDGRIWVCGGFTEPFGAATALCEAYDPVADAWDSGVADLPQPLDHGKMAEVNGRLYFLGGGSVLLNTNSDVVFEYDPGAGSWRTVAPMPQARWAPSVGVHEGRIYVIGGENFGGADTSSLLEFTPPDPGIPGDPGTWRTLTASLPLEVNHHTAEVVAGRFLVISGRDEANVNRAEVWEFDLTADPVPDPQRRGDIPTPRGGIASSVLWGRIHVFGGEEFNPDGTFDEHEVLDIQSPDAVSWYIEAPMPTARHGLVAEAVGDEIFVLGGGPIAGLDTSTLNEVFLPAGPICAEPTPVVEGDTSFCEGATGILDASASTIPGCDAADRRYVWEDAARRVPAVGPAWETGPLPPGRHPRRLAVWCAADPECLSTLEFDLEVTASPRAVAGFTGGECEGSTATLDGTGSEVPGCSAADRRYRWEDAAGREIGSTAVTPTSGLPFGDNLFTLTVWCAGSPGCVDSAELVIETRAFPEPDIRGETTVCQGEAAMLDASGSIFQSCPAGLEIFEWFDPDGDPVAAGPLLDTGPLEAGLQEWSLRLSCGLAIDPCPRDVPVFLQALTDDLPGPLGPDLRLARQGDDLVFGWVPIAFPADEVEIVARAAAAGPPQPVAMDGASRSVLIAPFLDAEARAPGEAANADRLTYYKVRGLSLCSGTPGPTCAGTISQVPCP